MEKKKMTYVWIQESAGSLRYVDDIYIAPCQKCGKRISVCECGKEEEPEDKEIPCGLCSSTCKCDDVYEAQRDREVEDYYDGKE
jgi:hypothetical protein